MNKIFHYGIILFIIVGLIFNKQEAMLKALLQTPFDVFELCKTLILSICLWNGLLKIIQASNMVNHLNFLFKLFYKNDNKNDWEMYTPEELVKFTPKPVYIQYQ